MREAEIIELIRYVVSPILPDERGCRAERPPEALLRDISDEDYEYVFGFSMPPGAGDASGYFRYACELLMPGCAMYSICNYTHRMPGLNFPAKSAWDFRAEGMFAQGSFSTVQNELYFTP